MKYGVLLSTSISVISEFVTFIEDNSVMLVISAVVIYFLVRVLNAMLDQNSKLVSEWSPKIDQLEDAITDLMVKYNESEARQNLLMNKHFSEIQNEEKDVMNKLKALNKDIVSISKSLSELSDEIEKQHMYIEFYQEQLKKEKGQ